MTTPNQPLGMADFFALEAGEYLERLDGLLQVEGAPAVEEFVRLSRALRGSALMANQQAIARAAAGLESLARALREGRRTWDPGTRQLAIRAVDDLKIFVRRAGSWSEADTAKADALAAQLEQSGGRPSAQIRAAEALGLDAGARAFVAREGAAIASALDRAAKALRVNPLAHDPLQQVLRALQPLRGLAALNDLPPLPDLLEGIERAIGELSQTGAGPSGAGELFQAAASAIAHAAREVAERGRPDPEGGDFRHFATLLVHFTDSEPDVVPVESLFFADAGPHIVQRGTAAARPATLGRLELVSHGEHLRQAADSLERAPSATQRELRAHTLAGTFRALSNVGGGGGLAEQVALFAVAAREAVTRGSAVSLPAQFAAELRKAGEIFVASASGDEAALATQLAGLTAAMRTLGGGTATAPPPARVSQPGAVVPIETLLVTEDPAAEQGLIGSWATYERLVAAGVGPASLDALLAGPPPAALAVAAGPDERHFTKPFALETRGGRGTPHPTAPLPAAETGIVDIRTLLYRGSAALERSRELRSQARGATGEQLRAIVDEVCDLVVLALEPAE